MVSLRLSRLQGGSNYCAFKCESNARKDSWFDCRLKRKEYLFDGNRKLGNPIQGFEAQLRFLLMKICLKTHFAQYAGIKHSIYAKPLVENLTKRAHINFDSNCKVFGESYKSVTKLVNHMLGHIILIHFHSIKNFASAIQCTSRFGFHAHWIPVGALV